MAGRNLRFAMVAGACSAALSLLVPPALAQAGGEPGTPFELAFWQAVSASNDPVLYEAYLKQYPSGTFAAIARVKSEGMKVAGLNKPAVPAAPTPLPALLPLFGTGVSLTAPGAASALRDAAAAQRTAEAAQAAAASAIPLAIPDTILPADRPVVTALTAPAAPIAAPSFQFAPSSTDTAQDLFGNAAGMPVGSAALLASLSGDAPPPARPAMPTAVPTLAFAEPAPAPAAPQAMLAALGAAPAVLPTAEALQAAVAEQATPQSIPVQLASVQLSAAAPLPAQPAYVPMRPAPIMPPPRVRRDGREARFMRAVVSSAAVSVEMPDASSQISPLGIMLGQLVRSQETPGTQYGLQDEVAMPLRPRLIAVPEVALPPSFCSIDQRSAFDEGIYRPALAIAEHNAEAASAYVRRLRTLYDNYQLSGDSTALQSVAAEARDFARAANAANSIHDALVNQFEDIMTIPVGSCGAIQ